MLLTEAFQLRPTSRTPRVIIGPRLTYLNIVANKLNSNDSDAQRLGRVTFSPLFGAPSQSVIVLPVSQQTGVTSSIPGCLSNLRLLEEGGGSVRGRGR